MGLGANHTNFLTRIFRKKHCVPCSSEAPHAFVKYFCTVFAVAALFFLLPAHPAKSISPLVCDIHCAEGTVLNPETCSCASKPDIAKECEKVRNYCAATGGAFVSRGYGCQCLPKGGSGASSTGGGNPSDECPSGYVMTIIPGQAGGAAMARCIPAGGGSNGGTGTSGGVTSSSSGTGVGNCTPYACPPGYSWNKSGCRCSPLPSSNGGTGTSGGGASSSGITNNPVNPNPPTCKIVSCPTGQKLNSTLCKCEAAGPDNPSCAPRACDAGLVWDSNRCACIAAACPSGQQRIYNSQGESCMSTAAIHAAMLEIERMVQNGATPAEVMAAQCEYSNSERSYKSCLARVTALGGNPNGSSSSSSSSSSTSGSSSSGGQQNCAVESYCKGIASSSYIYDAPACACKPALACNQYGCPAGTTGKTTTTPYGNGSIQTCSCAGTTDECPLKSCDPGYRLDTVRCQCVMDAGHGSSSGACMIKTCTPGYAWDSASCSCKCTLSDGCGVNSSGSGTGGGTCPMQSCPSGFSWNSSLCACKGNPTNITSNCTNNSCRPPMVGVRNGSGQCTCVNPSCPPERVTSCTQFGGTIDVNSCTCTKPTQCSIMTDAQREQAKARCEAGKTETYGIGGEGCSMTVMGRWNAGTCECTYPNTQPPSCKRCQAPFVSTGKDQCQPECDSGCKCGLSPNENQVLDEKACVLSCKTIKCEPGYQQGEDCACKPIPGYPCKDAQGRSGTYDNDGKCVVKEVGSSTSTSGGGSGSSSGVASSSSGAASSSSSGGSCQAPANGCVGGSKNWDPVKCKCVVVDSGCSTALPTRCGSSCYDPTGSWRCCTIDDGSNVVSIVKPKSSPCVTDPKMTTLVCKGSGVNADAGQIDLVYDSNYDVGYCCNHTTPQERPCGLSAFTYQKMQAKDPVTMCGYKTGSYECNAPQ